MNSRRTGQIIAIGALAYCVVGAAPSAYAADTVIVQATLSGASSEVQETNLGDLVADAVRQSGHTDIALVASDEIAEVLIPAGSMSTDKILKGLQYADDPSDTVVILSLTGAQVIAAAERSVSRSPQPFDGFFQLSGMTLLYSVSKPEGKRVISASVGGTEVDPGKTYRVATTRPVAFGSFGYFKVWSKKDIVSDTGISVAKSVTSYLSTHKLVSGALENRIAPR